MSGRPGASTAGETIQFPTPLDGRIVAFARVVDAHYGEFWAPTSALPSPKRELFELLRTARQPTHRVEPAYMWLTDLMVDVTLFVPDADLRAAQPFMGSGGGITGRVITDESAVRERDRVYRLFRDHRANRERLLSSASIDAGRNPIGKAIWTRAGRIRHYHRAEDGYAAEPDASEPPKPLDDPGAIRGVMFFGWLPGLVTAGLGALALLVLGRPIAASVTLIGGPIVAYVTCLSMLFAGGQVVSGAGASARVQDRFVTVTALIGAPLAVGIAVVAWVNPMWAFLITMAAIVWVLVVFGFVWATD